jgi:hypothetical protein
MGTNVGCKRLVKYDKNRPIMNGIDGRRLSNYIGRFFYKGGDEINTGQLRMEPFRGNVAKKGHRFNSNL